MIDSGGVKTISSRGDHRGGGGGGARKNDNNHIEWTTDRRRCNALMLIRSTSYSAAL